MTIRSMNPNEIRILVVDDDPEIVHGTNRLLEQAGYSTATALSGEEAWQSIRAQRPDLVLLDRDMPGLESGADGYIVRPIANRELVARVEAIVRILHLTRSVREHARALQANNEELRRFNKLMVGRELRMIELKQAAPMDFRF